MPLGIQDIARLINHSRTTEIDPTPRIKERGWSVHSGKHKVHESSFPFRVVYLTSNATQHDLLNAAQQLTDDNSTHVVAPATILAKHNAFISGRRLFEKAKHTWTTKEYLLSYVTEEVQKYLEKMRSLAPRYYIDPRVETPSGIPRKVPNPVLSFLRGDRFESGLEEGALTVLLAEPGQGKTYMSRHLVAEIAGAGKVVPLLVDSSQWHSMSTDELSSLLKTISHSFRHFEAPISWLDGHEAEFLEATLSEDIFRIVFDGFDEYILRNRGSVQPLEALESLAALARDNKTRIIITSRTDFWNTNLPDDEIKGFLTTTRSFVYSILPFDRETARNYFKQRFDDQIRIDRAVNAYATLEQAGKGFVGRGFVLSLIADLVEDGKWKAPIAGSKGKELLWLIEALCEREVLRHQLPFNAQEQLEILRTFAIEVAQGAKPNSELLDLAMGVVRPQLDSTSRQETLEKLRIHPLIKWEEARDIWSFRQEQIGILLIAAEVLRASSARIAAFIGKAKLDVGVRQDISTAILDLSGAQSVHDEKSLAALNRIATAMSSVGDLYEDTLARTGEGPRLAAVLTLMAVERLLPKGSSHQERTAFLLKILGRSKVESLSFTGTVARYDFRGIVFEGCRFERITWANCRFDSSTVFRYCHFVGGNPPLHCEGLGSATVELSCRLDSEAESLFNSARVKEGRRDYSEADLRADVASVFDKFIIKGGIGIKTVDENNLGRGAISVSRFKNEILTAIGAIVEEHHISGTSKRGFNIRDDAREAMKFYATNNVFTGPLRDIYDQLKRKLLGS